MQASDTTHDTTRMRKRRRQILVPVDLDEAVERFRVEDMRPDWSNALFALAVEGLDARRRRKPLRPLAPLRSQGDEPKGAA